MLLPEIGEAGQQKLLQSKVLVVGAGGLGCPVLQYLAAAGVGTIGIVDDDVVSLSNLHRQVIFRMDDIGQSKALRATTSLQQLNPSIQINPYDFRLTNQNALEIIAEYDIVVDGTDNFSSRYMINDACVLLNKPLVYAAISTFEGQVAIFNAVNKANEKLTNYRDLFPIPPTNNEVLNCAEAGVLGMLPGIIGCMQANEAIKLIAGIGVPLINRLLTYNALTNKGYELSLTASGDTLSLIPKDAAAFKRMNYDFSCTVNNVFELDANTFSPYLTNANATIIDVREEGELPIIEGFDHLHIPLSRLEQNIASLKGETIITFCQSGKRSRQAAQLLFNTFATTRKIYSLKDGIISWMNQQQEQ
ncbi:MAG: moeB [Segetibacter sp.]|nr:moeB [Segetibacter sp.]